MAGSKREQKKARKAAQPAEAKKTVIQHLLNSGKFVAFLLTAGTGMGHKQISLTMRYSHLAPQPKLAAIERLAAAASSVPQTANSTVTTTATNHNDISKLGKPSRNPVLALLGVREEDYVRGVVAVSVGELFAVRRPGECPDLAEGKVRDLLFGAGAKDREGPKIGSTAGEIEESDVIFRAEIHPGIGGIKRGRNAGVGFVGAGFC